MSLRGRLPAVLHGISFALALNVQHMMLWLGDAWLPFFLAGCFFLLYDDSPETPNPVRGACAAWLTVLALSTFIIHPMLGGAVWFWSLAAMPALAICMKRKYVAGYMLVFGFLLSAYALLLIGQFALSVSYTNISYNWFNKDHIEGTRYAAAWPLVDPNNAAAVINVGLLSSLWFMSPLFWLFLPALIVTGSKAGVGVALLFGIPMLLRSAPKNYLCALGLALCADAVLLSDEIISAVQLSISNRVPIWQGAVKLLDKSPFTGLGVGSFGTNYATVRTEHFTGGGFAHNDLLQFTIELGTPAALIFVCVWLSAFLLTSKNNAGAMCVACAVLVQSMVEFQFYVPAISILMGLVIGYHVLHAEPETSPV